MLIPEPLVRDVHGTVLLVYRRALQEQKAANDNIGLK